MLLCRLAPSKGGGEDTMGGHSLGVRRADLAGGKKQFFSGNKGTHRCLEGGGEENEKIGFDS